MKRNNFTHLLKTLFLILFVLLICESVKATARYWIGGGSGNFNDGAKWSLATGGSAIGGTITWGSTDFAYFDGNSGTVGTVYLNNNYTISHVNLAGAQNVTFESTGGSYTLTVSGTGIYGGSSNTLTINANTTISCANPISGGTTSTYIDNVVINGTLTMTSSANSYLNSTYLTVSLGGLFKTFYSNTNSSGGWWNAGNSPILNRITLNGTVEFSGNNQSVPGLGYATLKFSGSTVGTANKCRGNIFVTDKMTVSSGKIDLNSTIFVFQGTTFTNNGSILGIGTLKFRDNVSITNQSFTGSGTTVASLMEMALTKDVLMSSTVTINVDNFLFSQQGNLDNATGKLTIGKGSDCSVSFDDGGGGVPTGNFTQSPIYNSGVGLLSIIYLSQSVSKTTGVEMPSSFGNLIISNTHGIVLSDNIIVTNNVEIQNPSTGGILDLNGKTLVFQGPIFTNAGTVTGATSSNLTFQSAVPQTFDLSGATSTFIDILKIDDTGLTAQGSGVENLVANNIYFNNSGGLTNTSTTTTIGIGGTTSSIIEFEDVNSLGITCGSFGGAPTFNIGTNGLTVNYKTESSSRTIGYEMPSPTTNTASNIYVSNSYGVVNSRDIELTGDLTIASGGIYSLSTYKTNRATSGGTLLVAGTMKLGSNTGGQTGSNFPTNFSTLTLSSGGTVEYNGANTITQTVFLPTSPVKYANLTLTNGSRAGTAFKNITDDLTVLENLTINMDTQLEVPVLTDLTVNGTTAINSPVGLLLKSDATGSASFIDNGTITYANNGTADVERYLTSCVGGVDSTCWHYISAPITNAVTGVFTGDYMRWYVTAASGWSTEYTQTTYPLSVMKGWAVSEQGHGTPTLLYDHDFIGELNTGVSAKSLELTGATGGGYNLIGNPYPSAIDLESSYITWTHVSSKAWYLEQASGNYKVYLKGGSGNTGTRYVPSMQGFFVYANGSSPSVTFPNTARLHDHSFNFYKETSNELDVLYLKVQGNEKTTSDLASIVLRDYSTQNFDEDYDAQKLYGNEQAPQLYTLSNDNVSLTINSLPVAGKTTTVPVCFNVFKNGTGTYNLTASNLGNFKAGTRISIEDKKTGKTQELTANPVYSFNFTDGENPERFLLHFFNSAYGINDAGTLNDLQIYSNANTVYVKDFTGHPESGDLFIYNMIGQEIMHQSVAALSINKFSVNLPGGYYIVRVITKDKTFNSKIYLN
ncbi:MAG: T9SS type A sorting domain-containing protein [Bacteroidetes bacterium]|nr:T9SS type A sorting domain-containing protein [Bacteroidota bacterium]